MSSVSLEPTNVSCKSLPMICPEKAQRSVVEVRMFVPVRWKVCANRLKDLHQSEEAMKIITNAVLKRTTASHRNSEDPGSSEDENYWFHIRKTSTTRFSSSSFLPSSPFMLLIILRCIFRTQNHNDSVQLNVPRWLLVHPPQDSLSEVSKCI